MMSTALANIMLMASGRYWRSTQLVYYR